MASDEKQMRLAFIDDEPWALLGIRDIIDWKSYGFECAYTFGSAEEAYETLLNDPVDAVVTDIRLPEMSGLDLAGKLLRESLARVVVIVSAYRDFEYAKRAITENVMYYLLKPLDKSEVFRVAELMREHLRSESPEIPAQAPAKTTGGDDWMSQAPSSGHCYAIAEDVEISSEYLVWKSAGTPKAPRICLVALNRPLALKEMRPGISRRHENFDEIQQMIDEVWASENLKFSYCPNGTVSRIQYYIATNYSKKLKNRELAQMFYMSEVYMSECFKKHTGGTIGSFIISVRIQQATRLLAESEMTIAEIAESVGYGDASYFCRLFRKRMGISPEQFRRKT